MGKEVEVVFTREFEADLARVFPDKVDAERFRGAVMKALASDVATKKGLDEPVTFVNHPVPGQEPLLMRGIDEQGLHVPNIPIPPRRWRRHLHWCPIYAAVAAVILLLISGDR